MTWEMFAAATFCGVCAGIVILVYIVEVRDNNTVVDRLSLLRSAADDLTTKLALQRTEINGLSKQIRDLRTDLNALRGQWKT